MQIQPFQGWVEDSCPASLRTAALGTRLFIFVPLGDRLSTSRPSVSRTKFVGHAELGQGASGGLKFLQTLADFSNEPPSRRITSFSRNRWSPAIHRNVKASLQRRLWCSHASQTHVPRPRRRAIRPRSPHAS